MVGEMIDMRDHASSEKSDGADKDQPHLRSITGAKFSR